MLVRILKEEGITGFYNGFGASMLNTFSTREYVIPADDQKYLISS